MSKSSFVLRNGSGIPYKLNDSPSTTPESMLQPPVSLPQFSKIFFSRFQEVCSAHRSPHDTTGHSGPHGVSATTERRSRWAVSGFVDAARHRVARPVLPPNNFNLFIFCLSFIIFLVAVVELGHDYQPTTFGIDERLVTIREATKKIGKI